MRIVKQDINLSTPYALNKFWHDGKLRTTRDYQERVDDWSSERELDYLSSIDLEDCDMVFRYLYGGPNDPFDVIDGRQRLRAINDFYDGKFGSKDELSHRFRWGVRSHSTRIWILSDATDGEVRRFMESIGLKPVFEDVKNYPYNEFFGGKQ